MVKDGLLKVGRVIVNLNREEYEFVDGIGRDALFSTGKRLTNNKILRTFVTVMKEIGIYGTGICNCEELKKRIEVILGIYAERRKYPRFKKEIKVLWRKLESMQEYKKTETKDIGEGGFRIGLKEDMQKGEALEFSIIDEKQPDNPIKALGRIAWIRKLGKGKGIEAGIELSYIQEERKEEFRRLFEEDIRGKKVAYKSLSDEAK